MTKPIARRLFSGSLLAGAVIGAALWTNALAQSAAQNNAIPDFSSNGKTWVLTGGPAYRKIPGYNGPGPILDKPGAEYKFGEQNSIADTTNPILKPWAKKLMDIANDRVNAGGVPFVDDSRCWLGGTPSVILFPGEAVAFLQTAKEVWILSKRDAQVRRIYLNVPHSKNPGYSWTGESVGHYENGDTLVVDTIGLDDQGPLDRFRTPHTKQLHVVERYRIVNGGKGIEIMLTFEDPGAFNMPWKAKVDWLAGTPPRSDHWEEDICADNGDGYGFDPEQLVPLPHADKPDF